MGDKDKILQFLLKARTKTYAGAGGKVPAVLTGSEQLEYKEGDLFYRDVYYVGNRKEIYSFFYAGGIIG